MAEPYTDEAIAQLRGAWSLRSTPYAEIARRLLATLDARDAAHRREIAELERIANRDEWSGADDWQRMLTKLAERDARIAELEHDAKAMEEALALGRYRTDADD